MLEHHLCSHGLFFVKQSHKQGRYRSMQNGLPAMIAHRWPLGDQSLHAKRTFSIYCIVLYDMHHMIHTTQFTLCYMNYFFCLFFRYNFGKILLYAHIQKLTYFSLSRCIFRCRFQICNQNFWPALVLKL